jgi:hypothetical protein
MPTLLQHYHRINILKAQWLHVQSLKIIMTGLKSIPLTFSFEIDPWGQLRDVLLCIGMMQA